MVHCLLLATLWGVALFGELVASATPRKVEVEESAPVLGGYTPPVEGGYDGDLLIVYYQGGREYRGDRRKLLNVTADANAPQRCADRCDGLSTCNGLSVNVHSGMCNLSVAVISVNAPNGTYRYARTAMLQCPSQCQECAVVDDGYTCTGCLPGYGLVEEANLMTCQPCEAEHCADCAEGVSVCYRCLANYYRVFLDPPDNNDAVCLDGEDMLSTYYEPPVTGALRFYNDQKLNFVDSTGAGYENATAMCAAACLNEAWCRSFDVQPKAGKCNLSSMVIGGAEDAVNNGDDRAKYYQRL